MPHDAHTENYDLETTRITNPAKEKMHTDPCAQDEAVRRLTRVVERHSIELNDGRVQFAELRKDVQTTLATVGRLEMALQAAVAAIATATTLATNAKAEAAVAVATPKEEFNAWDKVKESIIFWLVPIVGSGAYGLVRILDSGHAVAVVVK